MLAKKTRAKRLNVSRFDMRYKGFKFEKKEFKSFKIIKVGVQDFLDFLFYWVSNILVLISIYLI